MEPISIGLRALGLLKRFWYVLPILAMAAYCMVLRGQVEDRDGTIEAKKVEIVQLEGRNAVTQASLDGALSRIAIENADKELRAKRYQADVADARATAAALLERGRRTDGTIAALAASAADTTQDPCHVSGAATEALKGL